MKSPRAPSQIVAEVYHRESGRLMTVMTTEPGLQLYTGYFLEEKNGERDGQGAPRYGGLCLEAQHFADSPNQPNFPSTILNPGETYHQTTIYQFGIR